MKRKIRGTVGVAGGALLVLALTGAVRPAVFSESMGGLWEVSRADGGRRNICVADPAALAQYEHLRGRCTHDLIRDVPGSAEISYTCAGGGFGQSTIQKLTPRSLRIETQGISGNVPFHYVLQARRLGDC